MTDDFERDPLTRELRDSLARHAAEAPRGDALAERIIRAAERPSDRHQRQSRSWRTWALPLAAVGAVAAVVGAVIGIQSYHPTATGPAADGSGSLSLPQPPPVRTPHSVPASTSAPHPTESRPIAATGLTGVKILDLTFASAQGWALASADCPSGAAGRCTAMMHTTDGTNWKSVTNGGFNVPGVNGCADPCVTNLRFANSQTGYAFGPSAFFMTTDGGASWHHQSGGAIALETFNGNVIRVIASSPSGCPGPCGVQVETSGIGSTTWTPSALGAGKVDAPGGVQLARGGSNAYLLIRAHVNGGARVANSLLFRSNDNGRNWTKSSDPCLPASQPVAAIAIAAGSGNRVSALCAVSSSERFLVTSADAGAQFTSRPDLPATADLLAGDPATELVAAGNHGLQRSTDGGKAWRSVPDVSGQVTWVGFESAKEGRAITDDNTIWTTQDGGRTWRPVTFG